MSHHFITRNPMSEARRQHLHGPLVPMSRPLKDEGTGYDHLPIWDEQPSIALGITIITLPILAIAGLVIAFTGV